MDFLSKSWRWAPDNRTDRIGADTLVVEIERKKMDLKMWCMLSSSVWLWS